MRNLAIVIVIIAVISAIAAPNASAVGAGSGGARGGKVSTHDLSVQPGGETAYTYKLSNVIISS
jgi:hypothetical protein